MKRQTLILFQKLKAAGLREGTDLFYVRQEFGTHQGGSLLRRAHKGIRALFGVDQIQENNWRGSVRVFPTATNGAASHRGAVTIQANQMNEKAMDISSQTMALSLA